MKKTLLFITLICLSRLSYSQVPKKVVVEHFTNTKCSACAARNPGFYTNFNAQSGVIHLAVHPSSPYSACVLSMHNPSENDARTNYYGIFGGTPRIVIQGVIISAGANYASSTIFTPYLGQTSPASIKIVQSKYGNDSIRSRIVIKTEATHSLGSMSLFVALNEDTINYTGSNGEPVHYDVFRKSLTPTSGINITLPANVGDSVVFSNSSNVNPSWNFSHIKTIAILQETLNKNVVQAESSEANSNNNLTGLNSFTSLNQNVQVFNSKNGVIIKQEIFIENTSVIIYDLTGKILLSKNLSSKSETILTPNTSAGIYLYAIKSKDLAVIKTGKIFLD
jgi:hypothetical protein